MSDHVRYNKLYLTYNRNSQIQQSDSKMIDLNTFYYQMQLQQESSEKYFCLLDIHTEQQAFIGFGLIIIGLAIIARSIHQYCKFAKNDLINKYVRIVYFSILGWGICTYAAMQFSNSGWPYPSTYIGQPDPLHSLNNNTRDSPTSPKY